MTEEGERKKGFFLLERVDNPRDKQEERGREEEDKFGKLEELRVKGGKS